MLHGDAMRQIYLPSDLENGEKKSSRDRVGRGQSHWWKKVKKVKSEVNYRPPRRNYRRSPWSSRRIAARLYAQEY